MRPPTGSCNRPPRYLAALGDTNDVRTWSGIPYFFLDASRRIGSIDQGLKLDPGKLRNRGYRWNLRSMLTSGKARGWYFTNQFQTELMSQSGLDASDEIVIVSHFPLLPPRKFRDNWRVFYYLDATVTQLFEDYGLGKAISPSLQRDARKREAESLQSAERVFLMSSWAAESTIHDCGVPRERCIVVRPGANLDESSVSTQTTNINGLININPLRLGLVGSDWNRKGLPLLLEVAESLVKRGIQTEVWSIGAPPSSVPAHRLLRCVGVLNKVQDAALFIDTVRSFHFGCLLSTAEAFGISLLESLRLGVPVIGTEVGGIVDAIPNDLGFTVPIESTPSEIADRIEDSVREPEQYWQLRRRVQARSEEFTWQYAASTIGQCIDRPYF